MSVFVIAELGSNWRFQPAEFDDWATRKGFIGGIPFGGESRELQNAYRMIRAAKECGADAAKFQWVSDYKQLMKRRNAPDSEEWAYKYVHFPADWLPLLKAECDRVGIEFMCTAYLPQDVSVIAPFVKRFKVAAKEAFDRELADAIYLHGGMGTDAYQKQFGQKEVIVSLSKASYTEDYQVQYTEPVTHLHCVSKYPTSLEELSIGDAREKWRLSQWHDWRRGGLSDHTAHVLTGAVAVGAGARIIESHVRLHDTPNECPDYPHSLSLTDPCDECVFQDGPGHSCDNYYGKYVQNIRTAERML